MRPISYALFWIAIMLVVAYLLLLSPISPFSLFKTSYPANLENRVLPYFQKSSYQDSNQ